MVLSAFKYAAKKYRRWFFILFLTFLVYSSLQVVVSKLFYSALSNVSLPQVTSVFLGSVYEQIAAILLYPLAIGLVRIFKHLHEDHRFDFNLIFTDFKSLKRLGRAWLLGLLCIGVQSIIDFSGNMAGSDFQQMPFISGMLSAAFSIFIFLVPYLYVQYEGEKSVFKIWIDSFKISSRHIGSVGGMALLCTLAIMAVGTYGKFLLSSLLGTTEMGTVLTVLIYSIIMAMLMVFTETAKYGFSRLLLRDESEDELFGLPPLEKKDEKE